MLTAVNDNTTPLGRASVDGVPVLRVAAYDMTAATDPRALLTVQREIAAFVREFDPEISHAHDTGPVLWHYNRAAPATVPQVLTLHIVMTRHLPNSLGMVAKFARRADWVTGVSDDVIADLFSFAEVDARRATVIRNGVAPPSAASPQPVAEGPAHFLAVGRLVEQKGFDRLIDAFADVVAVDDQATLTIAGTGDLADDLQSHIDRLGLAARARLAGPVDHDRIGALYAEATAVVMPSRFEGLPLVALEAAWSARPVIGTDAAGLRLAVANGATGLLVPEGDHAALVAAMLDLARSRDLAREYGDEGRRIAEREWSLAACVDQYEALYAQLLPAS